jgi:hypothetical protein
MQKEYFILDPAFPDRLTRSGYTRTLEFVQTLFEQYARAGLSKRSDKNVAISGLLQRMRAAFKSDCIYGTFDCFLSRHLLWRVLNTTNGEIAGTSDAELRLPSWSWMSHDQIQFFPEGNIMIPSDTIRFGLEQQLIVRIFELRDCSIKRNSDSSDLMNSNAEEIGRVWLDSDDRIQVQSCVIVGKKDEDAWIVLLVLAIGQARFKRVGVGEIESRYISEYSIRGVLV